MNEYDYFRVEEEGRTYFEVCSLEHGVYVAFAIVDTEEEAKEITK
jgi:hypothetical protein